MITTTDITLGTLYFNGAACATPNIDLIGTQNIAIKCIDDECGIYRVQSLDGQELPGCLTFIVSCGECKDCPPKVIERCLCDVSNPCTGPCEDCVGGLCITRCKPEESCVNDTCVLCTTNANCPCNQECTPTGCQCPTGTIKNPLNDCCDYCQTSDDCGLCSDCINIGGINTCVPKVCPNGVCDPATGNCVECLTSGDCANKSCTYCDPVLKRCIAGEGQVMIGNDCIVAPDCTTDADCNDPCLGCGPAGTCIPIQCPPRQVPVRIGTNCECVQECDCDNPASCDDPTRYCTAVSPSTCGCLPCVGDCASGCIDPCFCDPLLNKCVANPCSPGPCETGADCGPGCGCDPVLKKCVPCTSLSCMDTSCADVLGCKCAGLSCIADDCGNAPCTTWKDCPFGCTCKEGKCIGCSNYPCSPLDQCTAQQGCACTTDGCAGDPDAECEDILALIKSDENCTLTGSLQTENCCQCSPLTLGIKGKRTSSTDTEYNVVFHAELRKGTYDGVNVDAGPLLDDLSSDLIAENEVPTSGSITYQAYTTYAIYKNLGSGYVFTGNSTEGPQTGLTSFIGGTAIVDFPQAGFKKIGVTEQVDATTQREAIQVRIEFFQSSHLIAPNRCNYRAVTNIDEYVIMSDDDWLSFEVSTPSNGIATTVSSTDCRDPFFLWRKDGVIFSKLYVSGSNNTYSHLLENPPVDELESCANYSLEVDCSCEKSINDLVTFCNPADINFNLGNCGKSFELTDFFTCGPNMEQEFYIKGGSLDIKFLGNNPPVGQVFQSDTCISELEYGLSCDDECKKIYINTCSDYEATFDTVCNEAGDNFTVTFGSTVVDGSGNVANIDKIEISGFTLTSGTGWSITLPSGTYIATVYPTAGCDSFEVTVEEDCCNINASEISRDCDGNITCTQDPSIIYEVNGVIQTDICGFVNALSPDQSATITLRKGACPAQNITLPSLGSFCCENYTFLITQGSETTALVQVYSAGSNPTLIVTPALGLTITTSQPNEFLVEGLMVGQAYQFTVNSEICGSLTIPHDQTECAIPVSLTQPAAPNCNSLIATVTSQQCTCKNGEFRTEVQDVTVVGANVEVTFQTSIQQFDAEPTGGTIIFKDHNGTETDLGCITCVKTVSFPKPLFQICLPGMSLTVVLQDDPDLDNQVTVEIEVIESGINIASLPEFTTHEVTVTGTHPSSNTQTEPNGSGIFIFPNISVPGNDVTIDVVLVKDGTTYTQTVVLPAPIIASKYNMILGEMCTDGSDLPEVPLQLILKDLELEDNCSYSDRRQDFSYNANSESVSPTGPQTIGLSAIDPLARYVKFEWSKDGALVYTEFQPTQSTLPEVHLVQGSDYEVKAICDPCEDTEEQEFCCIPVVTFQLIGNFDSVDITVQGLPGTYDLDFFGTPYVIVLAGPGVTSQTVNYGGPLTPDFDYPVSLTVSGTTCEDDYIFNPGVDIIPLLVFSDCTGTTYEIYVTNAEPDWYTEIISGTGSLAANGVDLIGLDEFDPPVFVVKAGTRYSATLVGTSPTSCFSSSTAATSSSAPVSSSVVASSSVVGSSSVAASSSATSSILTSSSNPTSSSNIASSPAPSSAQQPSSSAQVASSSAVGSSSIAAASSSVPASSTVPPSSVIVSMSSCPTILEITQAPQSCTYTQQAENPDDASATSRITLTDDVFDILYEGDCVLDSSCEGEVARSTESVIRVGLGYKTVTLVSGDVADTCTVFDGTSFLDIDISPGGHTAACGCSGCGAVVAGDLTYNGSNGAAMAVAVKQAIINGICAENSYVNGTEYTVRVEFSGGDIRVAFLNKNNPGDLLYWTNGSSVTGPNAGDLIKRAGVGIATSTVLSLWVRDNGLFDFSIPPYSCSDTTPCGVLSEDWNSGSGANVGAYGVITILTNTLTGNVQNNNCSHAELVATLTGGSCTPVYAWTGPGIIPNPTNQTIYVTTVGTYEVDVTGCPSCGILEDSEIVV